jgi:hypothetical protein
MKVSIENEVIKVYLKGLSGILHHILEKTKITSTNITGRPAEIRHFHLVIHNHSVGLTAYASG